MELSSILIIAGPLGLFIFGWIIFFALDYCGLLRQVGELWVNLITCYYCRKVTTRNETIETYSANSTTRREFSDVSFEPENGPRVIRSESVHIVLMRRDQQHDDPMTNQQNNNKTTENNNYNNNNNSNNNNNNNSSSSNSKINNSKTSITTTTTTTNN